MSRICRLAMPAVLSLFVMCSASCSSSNSPLVISTASLPDAYLQTAYEAPLAATGGKAPLRWSLSSLPSNVSWLAIDATTGELMHRRLPDSATDAVSIDVRVEDAAHVQAQKTFSLRVLDCAGSGSFTCFETQDGGVCVSGSGQCLDGHSSGCAQRVPSTDPHACGPDCASCGAGSNACRDGACACGDTGACESGKSCCGSGTSACADLQNDVTNCGACGAGCSATHAVPSCVSGVCDYHTCQSGYARCTGEASSGCSTHTDADTQNCGACGPICPAASSYLGSSHVASTFCAGGACQITCASDEGDCDGNAANGCETFIHSTNHCGGCAPCGPSGPNSSASCYNGTTCTASCSNGFQRVRSPLWRRLPL